LQELEDRVQKNCFDSTKEGWGDFCRQARLIGENCIRYNKKNKAKEWQKLGTKFLDHTNKLIIYQSSRLATCFTTQRDNK
jgi:hypothetical protein